MSVQALACAFALRGLAPSEKLVLLALANYANDQMVCWPSQDTLSFDTELSERTVWTALKGLADKRVISRRERRRQDGTRSSDVITLHFALTVHPAQPANSAPSTRKSCEDNSQILHDQPATFATLTTFEPSTRLEPLVRVNPEAAPQGASARASPGATLAEWSERLAEAHEAGGDGLNLTLPSMHTFGPLRSLCEPISGEPCSWGDVLDAVRVEAAKAKGRGKKIKAWSWIDEAAIANRDRRLAGLPAPRSPDELRAQHRADPLSGRMAGGSPAPGYRQPITSFAGIRARRDAEARARGEIPD